MASPERNPSVREVVKASTKLVEVLVVLGVAIGVVNHLLKASIRGGNPAF